MSKPLSIVERARQAAKAQVSGQSRFGSLYNKAWASQKGTAPFKVALTEAGKPRYNWRIVPYTTTDCRHNPDNEDIGVQWFKRRYYTHRVGINGARVCCLYRTFGKPCPVCARRAALKSEGADDDTLRKYSSSERELFNIFDYEKKEVFILDMATHLFGTILVREVNDESNEDAGFYVSPDKDGKILSCRFDPGQFMRTPTLGSVAFKDVKSGIPEDILAKAEDLDAILIEMSADDIVALMDGVETTVAEATTVDTPATPETKVVPNSPPVSESSPAEAAKTSSDVDDLDF